MKKRFFSFAAGALTAAMMLSLCGTALASETHSVVYNQAGLISNHKTIFAPGTSITASNGASVPSIIAYKDAQGMDTNYLSLRQISDLFDIPVLWDSEKNSVVLGQLWLKNTLMATGGTASGEGEFEMANQVEYQPTLTNTIYDKPILGLKAGGFTETDPAKIPADAKRADEATSRKTVIANSQVHEYEDGIPGATMRISFTNHSKETQSVYIFRRPHGSIADIQQFAKVKIEPEETLTRAFYLEKDAGLFARTLTWGMASGTETNVDLAVDYFWGKYE